MGVSAVELVGSLMRDPLLAYQVVKELLESAVVGPWLHTEGIENNYQKTYERRHISGPTVGTVCTTTSGAVWWTASGASEYAPSLAAARAEVDLSLRAEGFNLSARGGTSVWSWDTVAWVRRDLSGVRLARVWGDVTGKYEMFEFAFSDYRNSIIQDTSTVDEAKKQADEILVRQGWTLG